MSIDQSSWWFYFERVGQTIARCKIENCDWSTDQGTKKCTSKLECHLKKHPEEYKKRQEAIKKKAEKQKKIADSQPKLSFKRTGDENAPPVANETLEKRRKMSGQQTPSIVQAFTQWSANGDETKKVHKAFVEMLCVDSLPLHTGDKKGFTHFMNVLAPQYKIKSRPFYTNLIAEQCELLKKRIKMDLEEIDQLSLTMDGWKSREYRHSILGVTAHFLTHEMRLGWLILGCIPIKEIHQTGEVIAKKVDDLLANFNIPKQKIHLILRDNGSNMISATNKLNIASSSTSVMDSMDDPATTFSESIIQLDRYLNESREGLNEDSMRYWLINSERFCHLIKLVKKYHSAPPGSVESERLFSTAGHIVNEHRTCLTHENVERILFMHHNLPLYDYKY